MLYSLLVVPMKLYESPQDDSLLDAVKAERLSRLFDVVTCDSRFRADPESELLRHLRNSVSNVNFTISEKNEFEFWDEDPISGSHDWEVRIDREGEEKFTQFCNFLSQLSKVVVDMAKKDYFSSNERVELAHVMSWILGCTEYGRLSPRDVRVGYYDRIEDRFYTYLRQSLTDN